LTALASTSAIDAMQKRRTFLTTIWRYLATRVPSTQPATGFGPVTYRLRIMLFALVIPVCYCGLRVFDEPQIDILDRFFGSARRNVRVIR
jgi:hypothetical protein